MENNSVIKLHFPQKHERLDRASQTHPLKIKDWLDRLPLSTAKANTGTNTGEATRLVYHELTTLNRSTIPTQHRFQILEFFRAPVQHITTELKKHYFGVPLPLTEINLKAAHLTRELHMEMANGYKIIIDNLLINNATASMMLIHLHRSISYLSRVVLTSYQMYATCPPTVWHDIHQLYRYAEQKKLHESPIQDDENPVNSYRSISNIYKQCLLLALANPYQLSQEGITDIYAALSGDWTLHSELALATDPNSMSGAFIINLTKDEPPTALAYNKDCQMESCRALDTTDLVDYLHLLASGKPQQLTSSTTKASILSPGMSPGLSRWLISAWGIVSRRSFPRLRKTGAFTLAIGLHAAYHFAEKIAEIPPEPVKKNPAKSLVLLTNPAYNGAEKTTAIRNNSARGDYFKRQLTDKNSGEKSLTIKFPGTKTTPTTYTCTVINESTGGVGLAWNGDNQQKKFRTGEIVSIKIANDHGSDEWELAVIRWVRNAKPSELEFGIQMLAPTAEAVFIRTLIAERNGEPAIPALLLPEVKDDNQSISLITPANTFQIGAEITITTRCGTRHALLTETLENTLGFTQFRFMPVQTADEILTSIHQTHDNDFEGLWTAL